MQFITFDRYGSMVHSIFTHFASSIDSYSMCWSHNAFVVSAFELNRPIPAILVLNNTSHRAE